MQPSRPSTSLHPCAEPADIHHAKSLSQNNSPHVSSQGSFKTCAVAKAIVPRCPSSPPRKKGSVSAGLVFLPHRDSGQCVTSPRQQPVLYEHLRASWEVLVHLGPTGPKTTPLVVCQWSGKPSRYPPGSLMPARPTPHHGPRLLSPGEETVWLAAQEGRQDPRTATARDTGTWTRWANLATLHTTEALRSWGAVPRL